MKKLIILLLCLQITYFQFNTSVVYGSEVKLVEIEEDFKLFGDWIFMDEWLLSDKIVKGNLTYGSYSGWVGLYKFVDTDLDRIYVAVLSQVRMQPAEYVLDHRFFNKTATIVSNVNTQAVQSIKYTPGTSTSQITETYGQTINGGFTIKEEGASVSLGFAVSQTKSITTDEIAISIRTVDGSTTSTNHLETKFSFQQYKSKTAANRSLMRFNQVHVYYVDKTTYSNDIIASFKGSLSVSFYRNGFWNNHTMDDYSPYEIRNIKL